MLSGNSSKVSDPFQLDGSLAVFRWQFSGKSGFSVWLLDAKGDVEAQLASLTQSYDGSRAVGVPAGTYRCKVDIETVVDGWTIIVEQGQPPDYAPGLPQTFNGSGPQATGYFKPGEGPATFKISHHGSGKFVAKLYSSDGNQVRLLADISGQYLVSKKVVLKKDVFYLLDIEASDSWLIDVTKTG